MNTTQSTPAATEPTLSDQARRLCDAIEQLPASSQRFELSILAAALADRISEKNVDITEAQVIAWVMARRDELAARSKFTKAALGLYANAGDDGTYYHSWSAHAHGQCATTYRCSVNEAVGEIERRGLTAAGAAQKKRSHAARLIREAEELEDAKA